MPRSATVSKMESGLQTQELAFLVSSEASNGCHSERGTRQLERIASAIERSSQALERIAEAVAAPARSKERGCKREEREPEVTDLDRAAADKAARNVGLVFVRGRR